jgi:hypothetical protein
MQDMPYNLSCITTTNNGVENEQILDPERGIKSIKFDQGKRRQRLTRS